MAARSLSATDLIDAARRDDFALLEQILQRFPSQVDIAVSGVTALHQAAKNGNTESMKVLLRHGADIDSYDISYRTPLHYAVTGNQPIAVQLLLKSGANVKEKDDDDMTAPQLAFHLRLRDCIREFKSFDPDVVVKPDEITMPSLVKKTNSEETGVSLAVAMEHNTERSVETQMDHLDKCKFCSTKTAIITFRPCDHKYSCFECSSPRDVCFCGEPITYRSFDGNSEVDTYIKSIKEERKTRDTLIQSLKKQIKEHKDDITCKICHDHQLKCTLYCGHMFCVGCIKEIKKRTLPDDAICPFCNKQSRYVVLRPEWLK